MPYRRTCPITAAALVGGAMSLCSYAATAHAQDPRLQRARARGVPAQSVTPPVGTPVRAGTGTVRVTGVVFDSIAGMPLAGATVQLVGLDTTAGASSRRFTTVTDSAGTYVLDGVPAGTYAAGFIHPALDALGIEPPVREAVIGVGPLQLDLSTPPARALRTALCGPAARGDSSGALVGVLRDAVTDAPLDSARATVEWSEVVIEQGGIRSVRRRRAVTAREGGAFTACDLPADADLLLTGRAPGRRTSAVELRVPARAVARRDLLLGAVNPAPSQVAAVPGDSASHASVAVGAPAAPARAASPTSAAVTGTAVTGTAVTGTVTGAVRGPKGAPIAGASVAVWGGGARTTSREDGGFTLTGVPAGSYTLEVRAVGYVPRRVPVDVSPRRPATLAVALESHANELDPVVVRGKRRTQLADLNGFLERSRKGFGYYITAEEIERRQPLVVTDVLRLAPSLQVRPGQDMFSTQVVGRGGCTPTVYLDGMPLADGATRLNDLGVRDVAGIEVYAGPSTMPAQLSGALGGATYNGENVKPCGVIVVWTRR